MKLRNLLFGTMIACAFAACSNEDDPIPNVDPTTPETGDTELIVNTNGASTKAGSDISDVKILVFNGWSDAATLETIGTAYNTSNSTENSIKVKTGNKRILVLANVDGSVEISEGESFSSVIAKDLTYTAAEASKLSMNSKYYDVTISSGKNYLGYTTTQEGTMLTSDEPVYLYHNVAKVKMGTIKISEDVKTQYTDAEFTAKEVFILHAPKSSKLAGANGAQWGSTVKAGDKFVNGYASTDYAGWVAKMASLEKIFKFDADQCEADAVTSLKKTLAGKVAKVSTAGAIAVTATVNEEFNVYENLNTGDEEMLTLLVVKGDFKYKIGTGDGDYKTETGRYFPIAVGVTGFSDGYSLPTGIDGISSEIRTPNKGTDKYIGVIRNLQYNVNMTLNGVGYDTPFGPKDNNMLFTNVEVVAFGEVSQDVTVGE